LARRPDEHVLGRFLEVGVRTQDVAASLAFYESLGFAQAVTGDARAHPYAVVTDGRLCLGLHGAGDDETTLTWVHTDLARHAPRLEALGIELEFARLGPEELHELGFVDPAGQRLSLIEARTFSPPPASRPSQLGYFEEIGIPAADLGRSAAFWDSLGLVAFEPVDEPFARVVVAGRDLNLGLYDLTLPRPVLTFSAPDMPERVATLRARGLPFAARLPRGLSAREHAMLVAPEGTWLLLTTGEE
jgi:catechol 2,3-dioxygenase-like lactoylglutathione lyase family enzyme